ncbi:hypothetical protein ON010_g8277 [Phytophthora cinnamomi]|nr:hypothetical protein ON010_g8277 [Phytophthora cinnamomi]
MFMMCDSRTAYCHRFELYAGKRKKGDAGDEAFDHKMGAAAVVRNLKIIFAAKERYTWHTVVIDRYYSSVLLAIELLSIGVLFLGVRERVPHAQGGCEDGRHTLPDARRVVRAATEPALADEAPRLRCSRGHANGWVAEALGDRQWRPEAQAACLQGVRAAAGQQAQEVLPDHQVLRREYKGQAKTCFEIWHDDFGAGEAIPTHLGTRVVLRRLGQKAGVRKKTRRELQHRADGCESDNEECREDE